MGKASKAQNEQALREMRAKRLAEQKAKKKKENAILWSVFGGILVLLLIGGVITFLLTRPKEREINPENLLKMTISYTDGNGASQKGDVTIELRPDVAPITVENFKKLVSEGFYDGLTFHRINDYMIQGGDPEGTGYGGSSEKIKGEFASNGWENNLSHTRGTISMARSNDPDSASSQFFIVYNDYIAWDGDYAAFGEVVSGMDVIDAVAGTTRSEETPLVKPVIEKIEFVEE